MENLDIEKLSREMPYKLPKNTFESMQNNVLAKTLHKKEASVFELKWLYAAAAVILLLVMANFLINTNDKKVNSVSDQLTAKTEIVPQQNMSAQAFVDQNNEVSKNAANQIKNNNDTQDLTLAPVSHQTIKKQTPAENIATLKNNKINHPTEAQIDSVLDGFSSSEIASLSNNTEQDVYLDLYN